MKNIVMVVVVLFFILDPGILLGQEAVDEILDVLDYQVESWNQGNMDGYMSRYWNSDSLSFHSGKKVLMGWSSVNSMYGEKYSGDQRGILRFTDLRIELLSEKSAFVLGHWHVDLKESKKEGLFTLILIKMDDGWKIVHDHSS